ncbi:uncharacterized protein LOC121807970 [Salvia splendens]|uniref:uncharacterized protein LOC121807970 n=1 Tax=Salvia splendens TaxID=180675 RepID=UPI001C26DE43|nr:uncharacterized protein LOC121807970 [Salvia splendens]
MASSILQIIFRGMKGGGRMMSSKTSISSSPWLMLPPSSEAYKFYSLAESKVVCIDKEAPPLPWAQGQVEYVGSSHGWVASFNQDNLHTFLSDPITGRHLKLPDIHTLPTNIILSSSPAAHDCRAIMLHDGRIATCFPAHTTTNWLPICAQHDYYYQLVYSTRHNRLFCFTEQTVECWDLDSPSFLWKFPLFSDESGSESESESESEDINISRCNYLKYLVMDEHSGRLFLVIRDVMEQVERDGSYVKEIVSNNGGGDCSYPHKTLSFDVCEIDVKEGKTRYMDASLDGLTMFVGGHNSFALPAADFNLTPDSIYFIENAYNYPSRDDVSYGGHDIGIFNYVDAKISSIYFPSHASQVSKIALASWFTPTPH